MAPVDELPQPPWERHRAARRPQAKQILTADRIVDAAFEILDRDGLVGLSMRKVAAGLGVAVSALYAHVRDKEDLLQLMYERVSAGMKIPDPEPQRWQEQLKEVAREDRRRLHTHRDMAAISRGKSLTGGEMLETIERIMAICFSGGLPPRVAAKAGDLMSTMVEAVVTEEDDWLERARQLGISHEEFAVEVRGYFASLPRDRFPNLTEHAAATTEESMDERFELFIDVFVRGLATYAEPRSQA